MDGHGTRSAMALTPLRPRIEGGNCTTRRPNLARRLPSPVVRSSDDRPGYETREAGQFPPLKCRKEAHGPCNRTTLIGVYLDRFTRKGGRQRALALLRPCLRAKIKCRITSTDRDSSRQLAVSWHPKRLQSTCWWPSCWPVRSRAWHRRRPAWADARWAIVPRRMPALALHRRVATSGRTIPVLIRAATARAFAMAR